MICSNDPTFYDWVAGMYSPGRRIVVCITTGRVTLHRMPSGVPLKEPFICVKGSQLRPRTHSEHNNPTPSAHTGSFFTDNAPTLPGSREGLELMNLNPSISKLIQLVTHSAAASSEPYSVNPIQRVGLWLSLYQVALTLLRPSMSHAPRPFLGISPPVIRKN